MKKRYKDYLACDKVQKYYQGMGFGLSGDSLENFQYSLHEVEFDMEVDTETGKTFILAVNGVKLERPALG